MNCDQTFPQKSTSLNHDTYIKTMKCEKPKKGEKKKKKKREEYLNRTQPNVLQVVKIPLSVSPWSIHFVKF